MTVIDRIRKIISEEGLTVEMFANNTEISKNTLDSMFKKKTNPSFENLSKIFETYPKYSIEWLMTGKGVMLGDRIAESFDINSCETKYTSLPGGFFRLRVPLVSANCYSRYTKEYASPRFQNALSEVDFLITQMEDKRYYSFEMKGDSMDDGSIQGIKDRDILLVCEQSVDVWKSVLAEGKYSYWVLVLQNAIVCKRIIAFDEKQDILECQSLNSSPEYTDFKLKIGDVCQLFGVVAKQSLL